MCNLFVADHPHGKNEKLQKSPILTYPPEKKLFCLKLPLVLEVLLISFISIKLESLEVKWECLTDKFLTRKLLLILKVKAARRRMTW